MRICGSNLVLERGCGAPSTYLFYRKRGGRSWLFSDEFTSVEEATASSMEFYNTEADLGADSETPQSGVCDLIVEMRPVPVAVIKRVEDKFEIERL